MGVGSLLVSWWIFAALILLFYLIVTHLPSRKSSNVGSSLPDDVSNPYSYLRAWDRHLVSLGLPPISTSDLGKVGPIHSTPGGPVWVVDENGKVEIDMARGIPDMFGPQGWVGGKAKRSSEGSKVAAGGMKKMKGGKTQSAAQQRAAIKKAKATEKAAKKK